MENFIEWYVNHCKSVYYITNEQYDNILNTHYANDCI